MAGNVCSKLTAHMQLSADEWAREDSTIYRKIDSKSTFDNISSLNTATLLYDIAVLHYTNPEARLSRVWHFMAAYASLLTRSME